MKSRCSSPMMARRAPSASRFAVAERPPALESCSSPSFKRGRVTDPRPRLVDDLLPHTGTARLLPPVLRSGPGIIEATGPVPAPHPLVADGRAPCFLGLERGAPATAAPARLEPAP